MAFRANSGRRSSSPGYAESSSSQSSAKHPADQLKENLAMQKCRFLGMEPEHSEELKVLKGFWELAESKLYCPVMDFLT